MNWSSGGEGTRPTYCTDSVWPTTVRFAREVAGPADTDPDGSDRLDSPTVGGLMLFPVVSPVGDRTPRQHEESDA
ncbi:hypothetical protein Msi02_55250 [Microbispora siamensis]|uniref:DUF397 domain-containing protein n=1 Tax=Microbispora siamensis TaxID=564413 RepID=A0ABQ4GTE2_9ACTN|nr:hypothetical protein Msi02_55250 [Microbispora siamensis]